MRAMPQERRGKGRKAGTEGGKSKATTGQTSWTREQRYTSTNFSHTVTATTKRGSTKLNRESERKRILTSCQSDAGGGGFKRPVSCSHLRAVKHCHKFICSLLICKHNYSKARSIFSQNTNITWEIPQMAAKSSDTKTYTKAQTNQSTSPSWGEKIEKRTNMYKNDAK